MKRTNTRQRILSEALRLFAAGGFDAVRVQQIADAVGIRAPSLYKHFKSKQDIFDTILEEMEKRYQKQMGSLQMNGAEPGKDASLFTSMSEEQLVQTGKILFGYFLHDEYAANFRRALSMEQYRSPKLPALYAKQYIDDPLSFQGALFGMLIQTGNLLPEDPGVMALQFYSPVFLLLTLCDCRPEREPEATSLLEKHIRQFYRLYGNKEKKV
ncbi:TetR/AcrR family transcriptional regulator [Papillibacter cinnamivorans]|uniref:Transcriptional regulator, TetR family n=1 Tax=Papillibacter cinnamivorans DSM 12816 TaxID=1122930 RepID=A0A1W2CLI9_9FIRM|nr:TetR/AcrR family transcriptional regulator [Papillibacter cinnamivorans]SMC85752.1 transcriptional regulator, TetR family [Papillibacter cinnamivorans DSM 12816]